MSKEKILFLTLHHSLFNIHYSIFKQASFLYLNLHLNLSLERKDFCFCGYFEFSASDFNKRVPIPSIYAPSQHLLALYLNWGAATQSPERLAELIWECPKLVETLPKTRAFLGKVEEIVARAPIYKFNINIHLFG